MALQVLQEVAPTRRYSVTSVALTADNGYSDVLDAIPVRVTDVDTKGQAREHDL
jgi:hypothetical protein